MKNIEFNIIYMYIFNHHYIYFMENLKRLCEEFHQILSHIDDGISDELVASQYNDYSITLLELIRKKNKKWYDKLFRYIGDQLQINPSEEYLIGELKNKIDRKLRNHIVDKLFDPSVQDRPPSVQDRPPSVQDRPPPVQDRPPPVQYTMDHPQITGSVENKKKLVVVTKSKPLDNPPKRLDKQIVVSTARPIRYGVKMGVAAKPYDDPPGESYKKGVVSTTRSKRLEKKVGVWQNHTMIRQESLIKRVSYRPLGQRGWKRR